jgi:hypothetical protein
LTYRGIPFEQALGAARAIMPHLIDETGWGGAEWNYALGNIKGRGRPVPEGSPGWHGEIFYLTDRSGSRDPYRAYRTLDDGAHGLVQLLETRYKQAWQYLFTMPPQGRVWYRLLMPAYHPLTPGKVAEYDSIAASIPRIMSQ